MFLDKAQLYPKIQPMNFGKFTKWKKERKMQVDEHGGYFAFHTETWDHRSNVAVVKGIHPGGQLILIA